MINNMRTAAFVLSTSIALALFAVLFESRFWAFREAHPTATATSTFTSTLPVADAAPIPESISSQSDDLSDSDDTIRSIQESELATSHPPEQSNSQSTEASLSTTQQLTTTAPSSNKQIPSESDNPAHRTKSARRSRAKTFLVVFMGHSGSTAFTTELREHSEFAVERLEPLDHDEQEFNTDLALEQAKQIMDRGIQQGKIPGFKIRPFHILNKPQVWKDFVRDYDCRIIWQYRENVVKQAIGEYRNRYLNDTSVIEGLSPDEKPCDPSSDQQCTFRIDDMRFLHSLMNSMSASDELLANAVRTLGRNEDMSIVRYEDYLYRKERTMRETFDFLGVDWQQTAPQRQKASPDNLCEMVTNFQDVCDRFLPCLLWRPFLYDDVNDCRCKPGNWTKFDPSFCKRSAWFQKE